MIKKFFKGIIAFLVGIISLVVVAWGGLNIAKFAIYSDYYSMNDNICKNPGLNDGFVCQGIAANEENNVFIISGYMKDHSSSRLYITDKNNDSYFVSLSSNSKAFKGHAGGVATTGDNIYLASEDTIYTFSLTEVLNSENGDIVDIGEGIKVNNQASFVYTDDTNLYVGEFHDGENYITDHPYQTNDGKYYARRAESRRKLEYHFASLFQSRRRARKRTYRGRPERDSQQFNAVRSAGGEW